MEATANRRGNRENSPGNQACETQLDIKARKLYHDGVVIDALKVNNFLISHKKYMKILSWNITAVRTKMEETFVMEMQQAFDIVDLNEIKIPRSVCLPAYVSYASHDSNNPTPNSATPRPICE